MTAPIRTGAPAENIDILDAALRRAPLERIAAEVDRRAAGVRRPR